MRDFKKPVKFKCQFGDRGRGERFRHIYKGRITMKERYDLHRKIKECLSKGSDFSDRLFEKELDAVGRWISNINDLPESEILEKMPRIVELIEECARLVEEVGHEFLADEFKSVAKAVDEALEPEMEPAVGEANTSY